MFFSLPLLGPHLLSSALPKRYMPSLLRIESIHPKLPRLLIAVPVLASMLAIVHNNTIVHPFTLADNRHYMFYVFRILHRHPSIKYLATPAYLLCAWSCLSALGNHPRRISTAKPVRNRDAPGSVTNRVSFLLVWLLATTLSLCTAPLVEPRYFIVPWLLWRIHITSTVSTSETMQDSQARAGDVAKANSKNDGSRHDRGLNSQLWLETIWFLVINGVTGYIFLYWGFAWPQEPGKVQRFMW